MLLFRIVVACLVLTVPALAQRFGQNPTGAALTHIHLNSADPDAAIAFWTDLIGTATTSRDSDKGVSTLGALLLFTRNAPSGPSAGSTIDHIALRVPDLRNVAEKLAKTPYKSFEPAGSHDVLMVDGPDGVRIELLEDNAMYAPLEFSHIHFHTKAPAETQAWYGKFFGAKALPGDEANTSRLMGGTLSFAPADTAAPTAGRAIDHLCFEVKDVQSFASTLTAGGAKLDPPADSAAPAKGTSVFLIDPWGTRIELASPRTP